MNGPQMVHQRAKKAIEQLLADGKKRSRKDRVALENRLAEMVEYERANPWIVAA